MRLAPICIALALAAAGCGGGGDEDAKAPPPAPPATTSATTTTAPPPETTTGEEEPEREPREGRQRTPRSLAACIAEAPGVSDALVKGRKSEDVTFFEEIAGGRVDVVAVTLEGQDAELDVFLFDSPAAARKAAPSAGAPGLSIEQRGTALVAVPSGADAAGVDACLRETGYASG